VQENMQLQGEPQVLPVESLLDQLETFKQENADLQILLDTITEHSDYVEAELAEKNALMQLYIDQVGKVTAAAADMEAGRFVVESLDAVATRNDQLGQLARVFQHMAREVIAREQRLVKEVQELKIEIDLAKRDRQVAEITESDYFQQLQQKAQRLRQRPPKTSETKNPLEQEQP
jgi:hypothetical protein